MWKLCLQLNGLVDIVSKSETGIINVLNIQHSVLFMQINTFLHMEDRVLHCIVQKKTLLA